jgi:hypothetical protein
METPAQPDLGQVRARMDEYLAALRSAGEPQRAAVGQGLNSARSIFIEEFKSMAGFRAAESKAQLEFVARLNEMAERLDAQHTGASWGIRLFWMYALLLTEGEADAPRYGPELERLGLLGRMAEGQLPGSEGP